MSSSSSASAEPSPTGVGREAHPQLSDPIAGDPHGPLTDEPSRADLLDDEAAHRGIGQPVEPRLTSHVSVEAGLRPEPDPLGSHLGEHLERLGNVRGTQSADPGVLACGHPA